MLAAIWLPSLRRTSSLLLKKPVTWLPTPKELQGRWS
jgi:hypothetical protein